MSQAQSIPAHFADAWAETGLAPLRALRAFGMRRSGNHAIADWILRNVGGTGSVFFNNCVPGRSPLASFRTIEVNRERTSVKDARADLPGSCADAGSAATMLVTYEDIPPVGRRGNAISADLEAAFDADIIIYRGFLNWCASLLKKLQRNQGYSRTQRAAIVLKSVDAYTRMLDLVSQAKDLSLTPICYDEWFQSEAYRSRCLTSLGLNQIDNSTGEPQPYGGGSSFQPQAAEAEALKTDRRFEEMMSEPDFRGILSIAARDEDLREKLEQHFPHDLNRLDPFAELAGGRP